MLYNPKIEYVKFGKVTNEQTGERFYETPDGNLASVTTILGTTGDKSGLQAWRDWVGEEKANKESKEATGLGTLMHEHLEKYVMGEERPRGNNVVRQMARNMADTIIGRGLINVNEVWAIEQELWYPGLYAGTADLVILHNKALAIGDYKTTKKPKKEEWVLDYKLQSVAYALAHNEVYGTDFRKGIIFMVSRAYEYQEWIVEGNEFEDLTSVWLSRLETFYSK